MEIQGNHILRILSSFLSKSKDKNFVTGIVSAVFVLTVLFLLGALPEIPNAFKGISQFFSDIAKYPLSVIFSKKYAKGSIWPLL